MHRVFWEKTVLHYKKQLLLAAVFLWPRGTVSLSVVAELVEVQWKCL